MRISCHLIKSCFLCLKSFCFWVQYVSKPYQECVETLEKETSYLRTPGTEKYCPSTHDFVHHETHTTIVSNEAFWHIAVPLYCLAIMCFGTICFFLFFFYRNRRMSNRIHGLSFSQQGNDMPSIPQVSVDDVLSGVGGFSGVLPQADEISGPNSLISTPFELNLREPFELDFTNYANEIIIDTPV